MSRRLRKYQRPSRRLAAMGHQFQGRHFVTGGGVAQDLPFPPARSVGLEIAESCLSCTALAERPSGFPHKLGLELHGADTFDAAVNVVIAVHQPDVLHFRADLYDL